MKKHTGKKIRAKDIIAFKRKIYSYYRLHKRLFPWRDIENPYHVLVSEIMLQQTQTDRVLKKYEEFLRVFPDIETLAGVPVSTVYRVWRGLGYNRRALALRKIAQVVLEKYQGSVPVTIKDLQSLPGIGLATAGSIRAFAFDLPAVFIETNIRRVFLHYFFQNTRAVTDAELLPLVALTLDHKNSRQWYYALMDYGAMLGKKIPNPNRRSAHYQKQSGFYGSNRYVRGRILRFLDSHGKARLNELLKSINVEFSKLSLILAQLQKEGFIEKRKGMVSLCQK